MLKKILLVLVPVILSGCNGQSDQEIISQAKESVTQGLKSAYKPDQCLRSKIIENGGLSRKGSAVANCDSSINPNKEITFSELKVYRHKDYNSVCGIVSGSTDISRIGARFAYSSAEKDSPFLYYSKYPIIEGAQKNKENTQVMNIIRNQYEIERMAKCK